MINNKIFSKEKLLLRNKAVDDRKINVSEYVISVNLSLFKEKAGI